MFVLELSADEIAGLNTIIGAMNYRICAMENECSLAAKYMKVPYNVDKKSGSGCVNPKIIRVLVLYEYLKMV